LYCATDNQQQTAQPVSIFRLKTENFSFLFLTACQFQFEMETVKLQKEEREKRFDGGYKTKSAPAYACCPLVTLVL
jgi:hypothetical protein